MGGGDLRRLAARCARAQPSPLCACAHVCSCAPVLLCSCKLALWAAHVRLRTLSKGELALRINCNRVKHGENVGSKHEGGVAYLGASEAEPCRCGKGDASRRDGDRYRDLSTCGTCTARCDVSFRRAFLLFVV